MNPTLLLSVNDSDWHTGFKSRTLIVRHFLQQSAAHLRVFVEIGQQTADQLVRALPEALDTNLPSIEEIEAELSRDLEGGEPL